jgi:alpha-D-xyloside xylohydrolase
MILEFPDDPACDYLDRQYMLGESLLVAPIFSDDGTVDYYVPPGQWTHFLTGEVVAQDGRWQHEQHDYLSLPLLARPNSLIPVGNNATRPDYDYADGVTFHLFELADGRICSAQVPTLDGEIALILTVSRKGQNLHLQAQGAADNWRLLLRGIEAVASVENGTAEAQALGILVVPESGASDVSVWL